MKRWIVAVTSLSAIAVVVSLGLFLLGAFDGGAGTASPEAARDGEVAGVCAPSHPDCEDTIVPEENGDDGEGTSVAPVCAPGFPDCADTIVADDEDQGAEEGDNGTTISPVCAPGFLDCVDMIVTSDGDEPGSAED